MKDYCIDNIFKKSLEERKLYSQSLLNKYPDRVPIVIEPNGKETNVLVKNKYLMPRHLKINELMSIFRTSIKIDSKKAIFIFVNNNLVPMNDLVEDIYSKYKSNDGFLYIKYAYENTFG
jgi:GABA(A) receptor-associated protein